MGDMHTTDWLWVAGKVADAIIKSQTGGGGKTQGNSPRSSNAKCTGTVQVSGYTRSDGTEVSDYERTCPYDHDDKEEANKKEGTNSNNDKPVRLNKTFSTANSVDIDDTKQLKSSLSKMGYYKPDTRAGESVYGFNEYPNSNLETAIKDFQRDNGLKIDGTIKPGGPTEKALNSKYEYHGFSFKDPINANKNQIAVFDGKNLSVYQDGKKIDSWNGFSGKDGFQSPENQGLKSQGPLPEGIYVARQERYQERKDSDWMDKQAAKVGMGKWRGGQDSWGDSRVWMEPSNQTATLGRSGFTVHGGKNPGSAGCIDLTSKMDAFSKWFKNNGKDVVIYVKY
jgi:peptidoglycan hydrolase-like protein with peptidoglycan-binding domain